MKRAVDERILELMNDSENLDRAFVLLVEEYKSQLYWHIRRLVVRHEDAQDALQETFVRVYIGLPKFGRNSLLYTWLYRIATNEALRVIDSHKRKSFAAFGSGGDETNIQKMTQIAAWSTESSAADSEDNMTIWFQQAILSLPPKQRIVFNLRYYDELSYEDIAQVTGLSVATSKTNYHYAQQKVKDFMIKKL